MKKFFIIFIGTLFIMALIISQCNGDDSYEEEEDKIELEQEVKNSPIKENYCLDVAKVEVSVTKETSVAANEEAIIRDASDIPASIKKTSCLEIPRLTSIKPEQILVRDGYTTSYNNKTKNANWVAWHLTKEHTTGSWSRDGISYMVDRDVTGPRQELEDWEDSPHTIDHGHMCPAGDNKWSKQAMEQTFLLTNMCPQNRALNRGDWEKLERRCRGWAQHYGDIYISCGPIFYTTNYRTIGANKVGVPDAFFKVVLCLKGNVPKALGFIYPNDGVHHPMSHYVLSVDEVEEVTGIDFFSALPDDIERITESTSNLSLW